MNKLLPDGTDVGITTGLGIKLFYLGNKSISIDYAYKTMGLLGDVEIYTITTTF